MSRILTAQEKGEIFQIPTDFNFKKLSGSHFGVHWSDDEISVKICFNKRVADYIRERTWHSRYYKNIATIHRTLFSATWFNMINLHETAIWQPGAKTSRNTWKLRSHLYSSTHTPTRHHLNVFLKFVEIGHYVLGSLLTVTTSALRKIELRSVSI